MRGHGIFTTHSTRNPARFSNNSVRSFSAQSSNSPSPPLYWQCGSIMMRRPLVDLPPSPLPYLSRFQEPCGTFVDHCPYDVLDEEYITENSFLLHYSPIDYYKRTPVMQSVSILGDPELKMYWKLFESVKYSFHSFISRVSAFHDLGVCFSEISENTVAVDSSGNISFVKGKFFFVPCTVDGINKDFKDISKMFQRFIVISMGEDVARCVPNDFSLLQNIMDTKGFEMRYLIITHSSLLPLDSKAAVYMNLYQTIKERLTNEQIVALLLSIPYGIGWFLSATSNIYLCECLMRNENMIRRSNPEFNFSGHNRELFDMGRHVFAHRYEILRKLGLYNIWTQEVDLMWDILFGDIVSYIQQWLMENCISILRRMRIEDHFMNRKITRPWY